MGKFIDLTGRRFGRLVVVERVENINGRVYWKCLCDCGNYKITRSTSLLRGACKSCGCLNKEITKVKHEKQINRYDLSGEYGIGYTNNNDYFLFDLDDYEKICNYCWHINHHGYVCTNISINGKQKKVNMHRLIMDLLDNNPKLLVDHINHNRNDNRKSNLRIVDNQQNVFNHSISKNNTSGQTGVYWHKKHQKWEALIGIDKQIKYLGLFDSLDEAIRARRNAEQKYFGEYAYNESS